MNSEHEQCPVCSMLRQSVISPIGWRNRGSVRKPRGGAIDTASIADTHRDLPNK